MNERSRLAPEPIPRRDFLGLSAIASALAALLFAGLGMMRLPKAAVLPSPSRRFRVQIPESLAEGEPFVPPGRAVAIYRRGDEVYAVSTICTHLGCIVKPTAAGFDCPCHGSRFGPDGAVLKGPAPKPLPWLSVRPLAQNAFVVDEGRIVPPGTMVKA
jgi:cytochrome b6-f complex iron-sulfur subunit